MITINKLRIDDTLKNIEVEVTAGASSARFTNVFVWTHLTFRDYERAIDVSSLLSGTSSTEVFNISAEILNTTRIDNVYFVEFRTDEDPTPLDNGLIQNQALGVVANLFQYNECLLNQALGVDASRCGKPDPNCYECQNSVHKLNLLSSLMSALNAGIVGGFYEDVVKIVREIDKICDRCDSCPDYEETIALNGAGLGYQVIQNEVVDSGRRPEESCIEGNCQETTGNTKCILIGIDFENQGNLCIGYDYTQLCFNQAIYFDSPFGLPGLEQPLYSDPALTIPAGRFNGLIPDNINSIEIVLRNVEGNSFGYNVATYNPDLSLIVNTPCNS